VLEQSWRFSEHWVKERKGYTLFQVFITSPIKQCIASRGRTGLFKDPVFLPFSTGQHDRHVDILIIIELLSKGVITPISRALLILLGDVLLKHLHHLNGEGHTVLLHLI
jgi:hypothetical protein